MTLIQALINCIETYYKKELTELQSQVDDLQEQVRNTNTQSNLKDWEIKFLKEDVKRLSAKRDEKCPKMRMKHTEEND
jgi:peptidoglycan hydrolase CwlO-like protein